MWRDVILTLITVLLMPLLVLLWKVVRGLAIFREYPPHRHLADEIQYPVGMEPGKTEKIGHAQRAG